MAESLYVCEFSNGHIKVGRASDPGARIAQHADRLSCVGIALVFHHFRACRGSAVNAEARLIEWCAQRALAQRKNEWFEGLRIIRVREQLDLLAQSEDAAPEVDEDAPDFRAIVRGLMACGVRQVDMAEACACDQSCISDIASGKTQDPRYSIGVGLIRLAKQPQSAPAHSSSGHSPPGGG